MSRARYRLSPGVLTASLALGLAACGGGGGSSGPDFAPTTVAAALPTGDHVLLTSVSLELSEADRTAQLTVARTGNGVGETRVQYFTQSGSALAGSDFLDVSGELVWADGDVSDRTVAVTVLSDLDTENTESFTFNLESIVGDDTLGIQDSVQVSLVDSDCSENLPTTIGGDTLLEAPCYHASSTVNVEGNARLTLAPGTTVVADAGVAITVHDSASISVAGTASMPVFFRGANAEPGYWAGLQIFSSNVLQQFSHGNFSDVDVGIDIVEGSTLGLLESLVVNNAETAGVRIPASLANELVGSATFTDESGDIAINANRVTPEEPLHLPDLGAPYFIENNLIVDGAVSIAPGVDVLMGHDTQLLVSTRGSLNLEGAALRPITLAGREAVPGYWNGVLFSGSTSNLNQFKFVTIAHGGGDLTRDGNINIIGADTRLNIENSIIGNSAGFGVWLDNPAPSLTVIETTFVDNALGDFRPN